MTRFPTLSLSVILPVYNEAALVDRALRRSVSSLRQMVGSFEILLINDCSTDDTGAVADAVAREFPEVRVIHNPRNLRQGGSLRMAFPLARHDLVTHNAIDYPFDFDDLPKVLGQFPDADVVVVTRRSYPGVTPMRRFVSWSNRALIRTLFGLRISDYNFVQVFKRQFLMNDESFSAGTAFITVERILRAHHAGARVVAVEAEYHRRPSGVSTSGNWRTVRDSLRDVVRLWLELHLGTGRRRAQRAAKEGVDS
jgi:glycosyltransferase involved in cell wall biosynthesis